MKTHRSISPVAAWHFQCALCLFLTLALCLVCPAASAGAFTNPAPTVTVTPTETILRMELNGFADYGVTDDAADIAYTGDGNTWTFTLPDPLQAASYSGAFFRASLVADDHYGHDTALYSLSVATNGSLVYSGPAGLSHGTPHQSIFENWTARDFPVELAWQPEQTFALTNTSATLEGEWIGIDWIELHLIPVPEPGTLTLALIAGSCLAIAVRRGTGTRDLRR